MRLTNLDDAAPFVTADGSTIRAGAASLPAGHQSLAEATVPPGGATSEHHHAVTEELDFITARRGRMRLDGEERDVRPGDCIVIPPGARHKLFDNGSEPLRLPCCCAAASRHDDTVLTDG
jgi:mannose-6-phosphate isomerase-like protein (cupin superfamily)